jgi:hypothetical protein
MVARELILDVSMLEPPEPMMVALDAVDNLESGEYVHLLHRQEPHLLYAHLIERGMRYIPIDGDRAPFELLIWRATDPLAESTCTAYPGPSIG